MKHRLFAAAAAAALVAAAPTIAAAQSRESRQMMADLRILQSQTQELQNAIAQMNQAMAEALKAMNARITEQTDATRKSFADQKIVIDALLNDLRVVRERVDDNNVRVGTLAQEVDALRDVVMASAAAAPAPAADPTAPPPAPGDPAASPPVPPAPSGAAALGVTPQKLWAGAMADYYVGQYDLAIMGFDSYAKTFPRGEQADDALVYIGHSYFQNGKYDKAVEAYDAAIRTYPTSNVLPEAYVRKGESLLNLKDTDGARAAWEFVLKNFPDSDAALSAKQRIQALPPAR